MMKVILKLILLVLFFEGAAFASGRQGYVPSNVVVTRAPHIPVTKTDKEIESILTNLPRNQVSIHEIKATETKFSFTGTYKSQQQLEDFIAAINNYSESKRNVKLTTRKERFAGLETLYYEISGDNKW